MRSALGRGLLESTYEGCLFHELADRELYAERQKALPVVYKGFHIASGASSMSFQNNLCDLRGLGGEYVTAVRSSGELAAR